MGRKKKRRKKTKDNNKPHGPSGGFDYGCLPTALAVSSPEFPKLLTEAQVDAVAYGTRYSPELSRDLPTVSLVVQHVEPLVRAFSIFHDWTTFGDADAVELTFVLRDACGYVLVISPDPFRIEQRILGYDRTHQVFTASPMWCKSIDSLNPALLSFRDDYASARIAPYYLDGATYIGPRSALRIASPVDLRGVSGLQPLLKFEVKFVNENDAAPGTISRMALNLQTASKTQSPASRHKPSSNEIASRRIRALSCHFPVTLERIRTTREIGEEVRNLQREGIEPWQVEQALCNMVLASDINENGATTRRQMQDRIVRALDARYEVADGSCLPLFRIERIRNQVLADGNELLAFMNMDRIEDLSLLQARLRSVSLLECPSVVMGKQTRGAKRTV